MLLLASNASRSGQGTLEGVPSISSMDAERFGMASRPLQRYAFAGERVQLALATFANAIDPPLRQAEFSHSLGKGGGLTRSSPRPQCPQLPPIAGIRLMPERLPVGANSGREQVQQNHPLFDHLGGSVKFPVEGITPP